MPAPSLKSHDFQMLENPEQAAEENSLNFFGEIRITRWQWRVAEFTIRVDAVDSL